MWIVCDLHFLKVAHKKGSDRNGFNAYDIDFDEIDVDIYIYICTCHVGQNSNIVVHIIKIGLCPLHIWATDEITCLAGKMPSPNVVGPLSIGSAGFEYGLWLWGIDFWGGPLSVMKVPGSPLQSFVGNFLLCSSTNFVGYSYLLLPFLP